MYLSKKHAFHSDTYDDKYQFQQKTCLERSTNDIIPFFLFLTYHLPYLVLRVTLPYDTLPLTAYVVRPFLTYIPLNWTSFMDVHLWTLIFIRISVGFFPKILFWPLKKYSFISFQWSIQNLRTKKVRINLLENCKNQIPKF